MSHIGQKKVEAKVKYLYALPLYSLLVAHNYQIIFDETNKLKLSHGYQYAHK